MKVYRDLKKANNLLTFEAMSISETNKSLVKIEAARRAQARKEILKRGNLKIQPDKQGKHIIDHKNYNPSENKSILTHSEPQKLVDQFVGRGMKISELPPGTPGYLEIVNFEEIIGYAVDRTTGEKLPQHGAKSIMQKVAFILYPHSQDHNMKYFSNEYALLSMQSALLGEVTPELRAVMIDVNEKEDVFSAWFYYDGEVSEQRIDLWDCAVTEASADLGRYELVRSHIKRLDYPQKIPSKGYFAYLRKELDAPYPKELPKVKITELSLAYALLVVQHALLGVVTPKLRAVVVDFEKETSLLYIRFYYDGEESEQLVDLWQNAMQEACRNLGPNCVLDGKVERVDFPKTYPFRGRYAYLRNESSSH